MPESKGGGAPLGEVKALLTLVKAQIAEDLREQRKVQEEALKRLEHERRRIIFSRKRISSCTRLPKFNRKN